VGIPNNRFDGASTDTIFVDSLLCSLFDILPTNNAQVVVGGKIHHIFAIDRTCRPLLRLQRPYAYAKSVFFELIEFSLHHLLKSLIHSLPPSNLKNNLARRPGNHSVHTRLPVFELQLMRDGRSRVDQS